MKPRNSSKRSKISNKSTQRKHRRSSNHRPLHFKLPSQLDQMPVGLQLTQATHFPPNSAGKITDRRPTQSCLEGRIQKKDVKVRKESLTGQWQKNLITTQLTKPSRKDYQFLKVMGKGGFGRVHMVREKKGGELWAMKEMDKAVILAKKSNQSVRNENYLLRLLKHRFIVNMRHAFQDRDHLYLVLDLKQGGDLRYHICRKHQFTEQQTRFMAACIFLGLEYIHSHRIIHRDIKPQNLVFDTNGYLHITDLGIAKHFREENHADTSGTPGYMAPEVMTKQNHSYEVDYYALGVIVYELMMGQRPYLGRDRKTIRQQILAKQAGIKKGEIPEGWSIEAADFVNKLIQRRPMARLGWGGFQELRSHPWLRSFPWPLLVNGTIQSPFKKQAKFVPQNVHHYPTRQDEQLKNMIRQNRVLLKHSSVRDIFQGYTYLESSLKDDHNTTSSELYKNQQYPLQTPPF